MPVQTLQKTHTKTSSTASRTLELQLRPQTEAADEADSTLVAQDALAMLRPASAISVTHHAQLLRQTSRDNPAARSELIQGLQSQYGNHYVQRVLDVVRKEENDSEVAPEIEESIQRARGGGQPLEQDVRRQMESTFGGGLDHVRVHNDAQSDTLNRALSARAFTVGSDIFFRQGAYNPGSSSGRELIAHETTHVVQQGNGQVRTKLAVNQPGDKYEQEADAVAKSVIQAEQLTTSIADGRSVTTRQAVEEEETAQTQLQRQSEEEETSQTQLQRQPEEEEEEKTQPQLQRVVIQRKVLANQSEQPQSDGQPQQRMSAAGQIGRLATNGHSLQRACACGRATEGEGECAECQQKRLNASTTIQADRSEDKISPSLTVQRSVMGDRTLAEEIPANGRSQPALDRGVATPEQESVISAPSASSASKRELPTDRTLTTENTKSTSAASTETQTLSADTTTQPDLAQPAEPSSASVQNGEASTDGAATDPQVHEQAMQQSSGTAQSAGSEQTGAVVRGQISVEAPASADVNAQPPAEALQAVGASRVQELHNLASQVGPEQSATPTESAADTVASIPEMQALQSSVDTNQAVVQNGEGSPVGAEATPQRDVAITAAQTASVDLSATQGKIGELTSLTVDFAPPEPGMIVDEQSANAGAATTEERRVAASGMVNQFMGAVANRVQEITALGQTIPAQIQPMADTTTASITNAVAEQSTAITAQVAQIRTEAEAEAQTTRGQITQQHETAAAAIREATATARKRVEAEYTAKLATVTQQETAQLQHIEKLYAQGDRTFRAVGTTVGKEATQIGADKAQNYMAGLRDVDDSFLDGPLTYNQGKARADAATQVARGYHDGLIEEANKQADHAQQGKSHDVETVHSTAAQAREAMQAQQTAVLSSLAAAEQHSLQQTEQTKASLLQSVDQTLQATLQTLAQQEATTLQTVQEAGTTQTASVQQMAQSVIAGIQDNINQAATSLVESAQNIPASMQGRPAPELGVLGGMFADALGQLDNGVGAIHANIEQGITASQQSFDQTGQQVLGALDTNSQSATEQITATRSGLVTSLANLSSGATEAFVQLQQQHTSTTTESANSAVQGYQRAADGVQSAFNVINQGLERGFNESAAGLERGLRGSLSKMEQEIGAKAEEAASHVAPRWKSVVKWVLIIAVIIVVALVIGPFVIGAVGGAAAALGAGAAASAIGTIVGGAIVGALTSATMQVINNWGENKALGEGVGRAALIGAIGGAVGGAAGLGAQAITNSGLGQFALNTVANVAVETVTNAATGNLTWESFGMSVLSAIAVGAAMHAASTGRSGFGLGEAEATGIGRFQQRMTASGEAFGTAAVGTIRSPNVNTGASSGVPIDEPASTHANTPEVDESRPGGAGGRSEPEVEGGPLRGQASEADIEGSGPSRRPAEPETESPSGTRAPQSEIEAEGTPSGQTVPPEESAPSGRTNHLDEPEIEPGVVAKETAGDGHEIKVLKDGRVVRCTDCATIRNTHSEKLDYVDPDRASNGKTFRELVDETEAISAPDVKAQKAAELHEKLTNFEPDNNVSSKPTSQTGEPDIEGSTPSERANHTDEPEIEIDNGVPPKKGTPEGDAWRYERYKQAKAANGEQALDFDSWYSLSRGGRSGGLGHQAIQDRLALGGADTEVPVGNRAVDAYEPNGPNGKETYHQIGGKNERGDPIARERRAIDDIRRIVGTDKDIFFWDKNSPDAPPLVNPDLQHDWKSLPQNGAL